jgi:hypothetical protein
MRQAPLTAPEWPKAGKTFDFAALVVRGSCLLLSSVHDAMINDDGKLKIFNNFDY